jgi:hypothetical protein
MCLNTIISSLCSVNLAINCFNLGVVSGMNRLMKLRQFNSTININVGSVRAMYILLSSGVENTHSS